MHLHGAKANDDDNDDENRRKYCLTLAFVQN